MTGNRQQGLEHVLPGFKSGVAYVCELSCLFLSQLFLLIKTQTMSGWIFQVGLSV